MWVDYAQSYQGGEEGVKEWLLELTLLLTAEPSLLVQPLAEKDIQEAILEMCQDFEWLASHLKNT